MPCFNAAAPAADDAGPVDVFPDRAARLSGGAVAGIVVGCVGGVALLAAAALLLYRRRQRRLHVVGRHYAARGVKWDEQASRPGAGVRMQNLPRGG